MACAISSTEEKNACLSILRQTIEDRKGSAVFQMWGGLAWPTLSEGYSLLLAEPGAKAIGQTLGEAIQVILAGRTGDPNSIAVDQLQTQGRMRR